MLIAVLWPIHDLFASFRYTVLMQGGNYEELDRKGCTAPNSDTGFELSQDALSSLFHILSLTRYCKTALLQ